MNRRLIGCLLRSLSAVIATGTAAGQQIIVIMTPESVEEAIRVAADDKTARKFLDSYTAQTRAGRGNGPLIGTFSTPFARVVQAAVDVPSVRSTIFPGQNSVERSPV